MHNSKPDSSDNMLIIQARVVVTVATSANTLACCVQAP
jgi:hypothetical protein